MPLLKSAHMTQSSDRRLFVANIQASLGCTLILFCLALTTSLASAQTMNWTVAEYFDEGAQTSVAVHPSGMLLEFHQSKPASGFDHSICYHVGKLRGTIVEWGPSQSLDAPGVEGSWPQVAITKEGYVIFTYSTGYHKSSSSLRYWVGQIRLDGDVRQSITWFESDVQYDFGFHNSIAIANGVIANVYESGNGDQGLYYRIGQLAGPKRGDFHIRWLTGKDGVKYDDGKNPRIAVNNNNQVVEVHQVTGEPLLHHRRGVMIVPAAGRPSIGFGDTQRYDNHASEPADVLLDSGLAIELQGRGANIYSRTGTLSKSNRQQVDWSDSTVISSNSSDYCPAISSDGKVAVATFQSAGGTLEFSVAEIPDLDNIDATQWSKFQKYDRGVETSVAMNSSGLIVEFHQGPGNYYIWYQIGKLKGTSVEWGKSQFAEVTGAWPQVALSKDGYVIFVYSSYITKVNSDLYYRVGQIDPDGGIDQSIKWLTGRASDLHRWDKGFHNSIAINDNGVIVGVHESGTNGKGIYYRVGHLSNPAGGDYLITWDSGAYGIKYDNGVNPHISINSRNQIVEVHQTAPAERLLHYFRGTVSGGTISFGGSQRYDSEAAQPAVALLDSGAVLELHGATDGLFARTGTLSSNPQLIDWSASSQISLDGLYSAVATNENYALATYESSDLLPINRYLYYSVAHIPSLTDSRSPSGSVDSSGK